MTVVLGAVGLVAIWFSQKAPDDLQTAPIGPTTVQTRPRQGASGPTVPTVDLGRLNAPRPAPQETQRNPFRFESARPAPSGGATSPPPGPTLPPGPVMPSPIEPPLPVGPPPIPLRFIGTVEAPQRGTKLAVLSDGRDVFYGEEGDVIDGRYRIVRIGIDSIEMEYLDGRGRQTIRLTG